MTYLTYLRRFERGLLVGIFLSMVFLFSLGVVAREIGGTFASNFAWIEEAVRLMNVFLVFLGLGLALERGRHICIDVLHHRFGARTTRILRKTIDLTGCIFCLYLVWLGIQLVQFVLRTGQRSPTLDILMGYVYLAPVIGFALLALRFALSFLGTFNRFEKTDTHMPEAAE
ncbi:TRAP transporter small permease [Falsirhodobacter sp. alg1]|uniref:TRAP transporter small permease n=1 Tax=Falsirhodobacter sp. alg1 TaxID=1472418 RepID=UPI0005EE1DA9|nr:TRAP transporter small permease [Falsirhodobacter sp. alg1]